jgi:hypothetical protein
MNTVISQCFAKRHRCNGRNTARPCCSTPYAPGHTPISGQRWDRGPEQQAAADVQSTASMNNTLIYDALGCLLPS